MAKDEEKAKARKWLSRYVELEEDMLRELDKAEFEKERAYSLSSSKLSLTPKCKTVKSMVEESVVKFMTASEICADLSIQCQQAKHEIRDVIDSIDNRDHRRALRYKYLDNLSNREVAVKMNYSDSYMNNLLSKAIEDVTQCDKYIYYTLD